MRMSAREFLAWPHKAVTLLGMSGVGKTTLANRLPKSEWFHYSGDYRIGTRYLDEPITDNIKRQAMQVRFLRDLLRSDSIYIKSNVTVDNLQPISTFLGKAGDPARGGLALDEFQRRQRLHHDAEVRAMKDVPDFVEKSRTVYGYDHFINDTGGSVCELEDESVVPRLAEHTLILYLRPDEAMEEELAARQRSEPKPLYYPAPFFDAQLARYLEERALSSPHEADPDDFVQWVFPALIEHRRPRYEAIARGHGYTVEARAVEEQVRDEADFLELVAEAVGNGSGGGDGGTGKPARGAS